MLAVMGLLRGVTSSPTVVVSLRSGRSIRGAMIERGRNGVLLRIASVEDTNAAKQVIWARMDGDVFIPADNIEFWQTGLDPAILEERLG